MDIQSVYRERIKSDVTNFNCVYCLHCIKSCPERGVLSFTLFGKTVMASGRNKTHQDQKNEKNL
jgi:polyferredoxin